MLFVAGAVTGLATLLGGLAAFALRRRLHLILGFSAGAIVGVALLELLPEALRIGVYSLPEVGLATAAGFTAWLILDQFAPRALDKAASAAGHLGPGSLTAHSLLDGLAIGIAFQASPSMGWAVAIAVIAHDLSDGANTVNLGLVGGTDRSALGWLAADAAAPAFGICLSQLAPIPKTVLSPLLAVFAGSFLYIGAGKLMVESYRRHPRPWTPFMSALGFGAIFLISRAAAP